MNNLSSVNDKVEKIKKNEEMLKNSQKFIFLKKKFGKYIYSGIDSSKKGVHVVIDLNEFIPYKYKDNYGEIVEFLMYMSLEAEVLTSYCNHEYYTVHFKQDKCSLKNFSIKLFKYLINFFSDFLNAGDQVVDSIYIYSQSGLFSNIYKFVQGSLSNSIKQRMKLITNEQQMIEVFPVINKNYDYLNSRVIGESTF